jgi:IS605 OrfB family transposase
MLRTASIRLDLTEEQAQALSALRVAYANACNQLVPIVREHRQWNRVNLHNLSYKGLRANSPLGSQMCCNAIYTVCKACKSKNELNPIEKGKEFPELRFKYTSVHFDHRTYTLKSDNLLSLNTLNGRIKVTMRLGEHQRRILASGEAKEAELVFRKGKWYFNLVVESKDPSPVPSGLVLGVDVGENNLAACSTGKVYGGENLRDQRGRYLALRKRLQSNGSQSAKQKLRQVSGKEARRIKHINHQVSKDIVRAAKEAGVSKIVMEDLKHIRKRIKAGKRMRARLHGWSWRQLQTSIEYKAKAEGIEVEYVNPAYTSQTCANCGELGKRTKHRFVCKECGLRAHADLNASRNIARIGRGAPLLRAAVSTPNVGSVEEGDLLFALQ